MIYTDFPGVSTSGFLFLKYLKIVLLIDFCIAKSIIFVKQKGK